MKICTKYREPKMRKYKPAARDPSTSPELIENGHFDLPNDDPLVEAVEFDQRTHIRVIDNGFLNEKLQKQDAEIEDLRGTLQDVRCANELLKVKTSEASQKVLDVVGENTALKLQINATKEEQARAAEKIAELEKENEESRQRLSDLTARLKVPPAMTAPNLQIFSPKELRKQDTLLCKLMVEISCVREDILEVLKDGNMCKICYEEEKNCVLAPCGHAYCERCAKRVPECAFCKARKQSIVKIYW